MIGENMTHTFVWATVVAGVCAGLVACGGGGDSSASGAPTGGITTNANATAVPVSSNAANAVPILVSAGGNSIRNFPMVSVTLCKANTNATSNCSTIPNVLLDTGSYGLRVFASSVPTVTLNALANISVSDGTTAECANFGSGDTWGTVRAADLRMSGEIAKNVSIQVIGDNANLSVNMPAACTTGPNIAAVSQIGANGILGVGVALNDCGAACANQALPGTYYSCRDATCTPVAVPVAQQITNPVALFPIDNNGVIVEMAQVPDTGALTSIGTLVFGIDTQSNNALANTSATVLPTGGAGNLTAMFNGRMYRNRAFMDSGSNGLFFEDATLPVNSNGFFDPLSPIGRTMTLVAANSATTTAQFNVANATALFSSGNFAFNNLAAPLFSGYVDLGIPFYYGRHIYHGIAGKTSVGGGTGPYVAYTSS